MKSRRIGTIVFVALLIILILVLFFANRGIDYGNFQSVGYSTDTVEAKVVEMVEEGTIELGDVTQAYQIVKVQILQGQYKNETLQIDHGKRQIRPDGFRLGLNDRVMVTVGVSPEGKLTAFFVDYVRKQSILILVVIFVVVSLLVSGWKGIRSILSIGVSLVVVLYFIIPRILAGDNPIIISLVGSILFLAITQYLIYGWTLKTQIAMAGIAVAIVITGFLSVWFVEYAYLSGFGDENAMYLMQQAGNINIRNLLIASIIIGTLGVLDDLVIGQASAVIELHMANPSLTFKQRYASAMNIGRDHVAATVNTLVLAYMGAAMSMFLLFSINQVSIGTMVNINYIAEEIVRSLVGTLGLFLSVPITTFIACLAVNSPDRIRKLTRVLGPLTDTVQRD
ncbi:MAG: YibE/F family protein [Anaerolineaceae bacterium]|nr:YibE/F family protein [Anaerolineaceae bacterium]